MAYGHYKIALWAAIALISTANLSLSRPIPQLQPELPELVDEAADEAIGIDAETALPEATEAAGEDAPSVEQASRIEADVRRGESFFDIFKRHGLDMAELYQISQAAAGTYDVGRLRAGRAYAFELDGERRVLGMTYQIDDMSFLNVRRTDGGFAAERVDVPYEHRTVHLSGTVDDNLITSVGDAALAMRLSDIFVWDIDFTTDMRRGDRFEVLVEELRRDGQFVKYGRILAASLTNAGQTYEAYRFEQPMGDGRTSMDYYDREGRALRKAFLKAPLSYRRISSGFSQKRFHPVLRTYRPHLGVDYAAPRGTPVSTVGDGVVQFAGRKGPNGNLVIVKHPNGFTTYYGHLHRIERGVRKGSRVTQGQQIGSVGSTGRSTGPHLDYRIKKGSAFVNPLTLSLPAGEPVPSALRAEFSSYVSAVEATLVGLHAAAEVQ